MHYLMNDTFICNDFNMGDSQCIIVLSSIIHVKDNIITIITNRHLITHSSSMMKYHKIINKWNNAMQSNDQHLIINNQTNAMNKKNMSQKMKKIEIETMNVAILRIQSYLHFSFSMFNSNILDSFIFLYNLNFVKSSFSFLSNFNNHHSFFKHSFNLRHQQQDDDALNSFVSF